MAPVKVNYIVSFSSQDDHHKASNLVSSDGTKRWLSGRTDRSGKIEVILQLDGPCHLSYIDIGAIWCASLEVRVGRSDWPQSKEFKSLIPTVSLMTPIDCRLSRRTTSTQMFSKNDFAEEVASEKWDRLQIICRQLYRKDVQFGLSFINIKSTNSTELCEENKDEKRDSIEENRAGFSASSIKKHFFGNLADADGQSSTHLSGLRYRLMKIAGSTENGCEQEESLSRTAKIVLKAASNSKQFGPKQRHPSCLPKRGLFSEHLTKKFNVPIEEEMRSFFADLALTPDDIDQVTVADLRHKFERKKRRKLTQEEKKMFSEMCQNFVCDLFDGDKCRGATGTFEKTGGCEIQTELAKNEKNSGVVNKNKTGTPATRDSLDDKLCESADDNVGNDENASRRNKHMNTKALFTTLKTNRNVTSNTSTIQSATTSKKKLHTISQVSPATSDIQEKDVYITHTISQDKPFSTENQVSRKVNWHASSRVQSLCIDERVPNVTVDTDLSITSPDLGNRKPLEPKLVSPGNKLNNSFDSATSACISPYLTLKNRNKNSKFSSSSQASVTFEKKMSTNECDNEFIDQCSTEDERDDGNKTNDIHSLSSVSYSDESDFSDSRTTSQKVAAVQKAYKSLYNQADSIEEDTVSPSDVANPAKRQRLSKKSLSLLHEFTIEVSSSDDEGEETPRAKPQEPKEAIAPALSAEAHDVENSTPGKYTNVAAQNRPPRNGDSPKPSTSSNTTPKAAKGKIYRMYNSRSSRSTEQKTTGFNRETIGANRNNPSACDLPCPPSSSFENHLTLKSSKYSNHLAGQTSKFSDDALQAKSPKPGAGDETPPSFLMKFGEVCQTRGNSRGNGRGRGRKKGSSVARGENGGCDSPRQTKNGKTSKTRQDRGRGRRRTDVSRIPPDVTLCEKCLCEIQSDTFASHHAFCIPAPAHTSEFRQESYDNELLIDEAMDYAECPICMQRYPQDVLLVHASDCGI